MKKYLAVIVCIIIVASLFALPSSAADNSRHQVTAKQILTPPTLDGVVSDAEWGAPFVNAAATDPLFVSSSTNNALKPSNIKIYTRWDYDYLYVAAVVEETSFFNDYQGPAIWMGDSFEVDISVSTGSQTVRFRTNSAYSATAGRAYSYVYGKPNGNWSATDGCEIERTDALGSGKAAIVYNAEKSTVTYEYSFAWDYLYVFPEDLAAGYEMLINYQFHLADGSVSPDSNNTYLGCVNYGTKDADGKTLYPLVKLERDPSAPYTTTTKKTYQTKISTPATLATKASTTRTTTATIAAPSSTAVEKAPEEKGCGGKDNKSDVAFAGGAGALAMAAVAFTRDAAEKKRKK